MTARILGKASAALRAGRGAALWALALFALVSCLLEGEQTAKRGSEVENEIYGVLVAVNGDPVAGAKVKAVPVAGAIAKRGAAADSDSVFTDKEGKYSLRGLEPGTYNLFGDYQSGSLVVLIPGVDHGDTTVPDSQGVDTLRAPGGIRGRVLLGDRGKEGVFAYVPGTSYLAVSNDSGYFLIDGVPQGAYVVRYSVPGFIVSPDNGVAVLSGKITDLPAKRLAYDPALPPPAPTGLKAVYDTLNERVVLSWDSVPVSDLDGYVIYRDKPSFLDPQVVEDGFTRRTSFVDSNPGFLANQESRSVVYRIKSRDLELNQSLNFSSPAEVTVVSRHWVTTGLELAVLGLRLGEATPGDTLRVVLAFSNPTRKIRRIEWSRAGMPGVLDSSAISSLSGSDTLIWIPGEPGSAVISARAIDEAGVEWIQDTIVTVVADLPGVSAGGDTLVSPGDTVLLRGSGMDGHGRIVKWEWDIGATGVFRAGRPDTLIRAPSRPSDRFACILRATDDDGYQASDTVLIVVVEDRPEAHAGRDTTVSLGDPVRLRGSAADRFGHIERWEWDIGATGAFARSTGGDTAFQAGAEAAEIVCILRVTDDDGFTREDTLLVRVVEDAPVVVAVPGMRASIGDSLRLAPSIRDGFGRVVRFEWDPGAEGPFRAAGPETTITLPRVPQPAYPVVIRVTDDDGVTATDTFRIAVLEDRPVAIAEFKPGNYFAGDTVEITSGGSRDGLGSIRLREWDAGAKGAFRPSGADTSIVLPDSAGEYPVVLRITDDDGMESLDTLVIRAYGVSGKVWFKAPLPLVGNGFKEHVMVEFKDRLWILGGSGNASILNSEDGLAWKVAAAAPFGSGLVRHTATVFQDELWVIGGQRPDGTQSNQVWHSSDGMTWSRARDLPFAGRDGHAVAVHSGKLLLIGGRDTSHRTDTWQTPDGNTWTKIGDAPFLSTWSGHSVAVLDGKIFVISRELGMTGPVPAAIWSSPDGSSWSKVTGYPEIDFLAPFQNPAIVSDGRIWMATYRSLHSSVDGKTWTSTPILDLSEQNLAGNGLAAFRGRLWLSGGQYDGPSWIWYSK